MGLYEYLKINMLFLFDVAMVLFCWYAVQLQLFRKSLSDEETNNREGSSTESDLFVPETIQDLDDFES